MTQLSCEELDPKRLKHFPKEIKYFEGRIDAYKKDIAIVQPVPPDTFSPMIINGIVYTKKEDAGKAIILACQNKSQPEREDLGEYRGFKLELAYENGYVIFLKGAIMHRVELSDDIFGNITRLNNRLEDMPDRLKNCESQLAILREQMADAKTEVEVPFVREQELTEKTARLAELTVALKLDTRDKVILDGAPDEGDAADSPARKARDRGGR